MQLVINNTTQRHVRTLDSCFERDFSINNRILCDKRLDEYFYMGTFYATKLKILKSLRQNTYYELFIIDKGYRFIYSMKKQLDILSALILFTKGVGVPEALVTDSS